ncbi:hypothetical protein C0V75_21625 [Tabrizicola sp. TH137]|uniref:VIT domain-containing protein n=1 Tax=Tabrizicola sp. TH137 TaxID=2067452 RepID=UPI000C7E0516|nr:VIT domain-containing protein [Tabrizicola sp. TH137]PLL10240.1 hypothetical protein C0V75_21625 [Tabrizicola sp. TH137]
MDITTFGHSLETINDGLTVFSDGRPAPVPLVATVISVDVTAGLATVVTTRRFANVEDRPVEAILTMPVGFEAVVTSLRAVVDGRTMVAVAKSKEEAREDYEAALEEGRLAVLHEEVLRGIHALSVGNLAPGREVAVELQTVVPMSAGVSGPFLRIPVTVGQLYGSSPLAPVDDVVTSAAVRHEADLTVTTDAGQVLLSGRQVSGVERITLDASIEIVVQGGRFGTHQGVAADGRQVRVDLRQIAAGAGALDLAVLVDHSGSTGEQAAGPRGLTIWEAIRDGLRLELGRLRGGDRIALWEFDDTCRQIGETTGPDAARLVSKLKKPNGGTELERAVKAALENGAADILVLTDGQTWSSTVDALAASQARISAILVGPSSLDANLGQLCTMTGGQLYYAPGDDVAASLSFAFSALRSVGRAVEGSVASGMPERVKALRGGVELIAQWSDAMEVRSSDAIGRFAAALALPLLGAEAAEDFARAHSLCTHRTSLVLIDEVGAMVEGMAQQRKVPLMARSPAELSDSIGSLKVSAFRAAPVPFSAASAGDMSSIGFRESFARLAKARHTVLSEDLLPPVSAHDIRQLFVSLRWDALCEDLLAGNLRGLSEEQRDVVSSLAGMVQIVNFGKAKLLSSEIVALALIADLIDDRLGRRFVRRAFKGMAVSVWGHLRLWRPSAAGAPLGQ